jgi:proteasome beta subunit
MTNIQELQTGTTTVGILAKDAVILAAEKKATMGYLVDSKVSRKVYALDDHIGLTIAGSVGDALAIVRLLKAQFKLYKLERGPITVKAAATLLSNILQGTKFYPFFNQFILAGYDDNGPQVYGIDLMGGWSVMDKYYSTGSGSPFAYGVLEAEYKEGMGAEEIAALAIKAIKVAIERDIGSGGRGFTVAIIGKDGYRELTDSEIARWAK